MNNAGTYLKDESSVENVFKAYATTVNAGDFEGWINNWAENGKQYFPDAPPRYGKAQIATEMRPLFEMLDFEGFSIEIDEIRVLGNQAYGHGTYGYSMTPKGGGETSTISGKFLTILEKQADGSWKILIDCFNYNGSGE
jgi:uncharacterized protein (TIGR02246 family)